MKLVYPDVHGNGGWANYTVLAEGSFEELLEYRPTRLLNEREVDHQTKTFGYSVNFYYFPDFADAFFPAILDESGKKVAYYRLDDFEWEILQR